MRCRSYQFFSKLHLSSVPECGSLKEGYSYPRSSLRGRLSMLAVFNFFLAIPIDTFAIPFGQISYVHRFQLPSSLSLARQLVTGLAFFKKPFFKIQIGPSQALFSVWLRLLPGLFPAALGICFSDGPLLFFLQFSGRILFWRYHRCLASQPSAHQTKSTSFINLRPM